MEKFDYTEQGFYIFETVKLASGQSNQQFMTVVVSPFDWGHNLFLLLTEMVGSL